MTKKDFELIAKIIKTWPRAAQNSQDSIAHHFAIRLSEIYPRFDPERFEMAATNPLIGTKL